MEKEFAVFILVRVRAETAAKAEEAVGIAVQNAINEDNTGLQPAGKLVSYEHQDVIENN